MSDFSHLTGPGGSLQATSAGEGSARHEESNTKAVHAGSMVGENRGGFPLTGFPVLL